MRDDRERVLDILEAIERIERVAASGRDHFYDDEMAQRLGSSTTSRSSGRGISPEFRAAHPEIPWSDIVGMRNILIHHYFGIDRDAVWNVVEDDGVESERRYGG
ncbi:HepT-like ribonuclease domain-containing protein [Methanoculleus sp.]|uniref:HepT-like ribonuclease domain-containing protein n=1 Tax=Methanoculleus sp. TaxID=90427 RepID=UPI002FCC5D33